MVLFSIISEEQIQAQKELKIKEFLIDYTFILNRNSVFRKEALFELKSMLIENEKVEYLTFTRSLFVILTNHNFMNPLI
ncbi:hypothetical protein HH195_11690 (plasmid) [Sarcina sp. JB2]|uniref:Uncharacterized protein n=1 Tax=Candidatus Sarcina troglodytae TaxID=2726954 RepID=A0ACD1BH06_9CLOT|nr:hypothetical protein [Sarcina sp. JB2]QPJ86623.1 hypothetical protein HH195_11690 [Sarcina sp. JB2]